MVPHPTYPPTLGATPRDEERCLFRVWAPHAQSLELRLLEDTQRTLPMHKCERGYYELLAEGVRAGARYMYRIDGERDRPDPASRFQPDGVHRASAVVDADFDWSDCGWSGVPLREYITYELHVGTYTAEGTFAAAAEHLAELRDLGVTAIELMPVSQFPGGRNWGYDGVHPFAVQNTYGGPDGLKRFVDTAHAHGLAVVLDVVYNHLGPEGNYLAEFGPYFTDRYRTPWGQAVNFDDRGSDEVRRFFIENALYWIRDFHIDALRLDAVHAIYDDTAQPFLQELATAVRVEGERLDRRVYTIAESSLGDPRLLAPAETGGCGIDAQWNDDLHHALRTALAEERSGYYQDFRGFDDVVKAYRDGFVLDGRWSESRGRRHGASARHIEPHRLVVCTQNHDQVGNRLWGERLTELVSFEQLKLAAGVILLSPYQPLLFMGEEYGEPARFQYFVSHGDPGLIEAVRRGRREEFQSFGWTQDAPDAQDEKTFLQCKLDHSLKDAGQHRILYQFYRELIRLRKSEPALALADRDRIQTDVLKPESAYLMRYWDSTSEVMALFHFGSEAAIVEWPLASGSWTRILCSADLKWSGPGAPAARTQGSGGSVSATLAPFSVVVYRRD